MDSVGWDDAAEVTPRATAPDETLPVEYLRYPGAEGRFFRCSAYRALLSVESCGKRYRAAQDATGDRAARLELCRGCRLGSGHSGRTFVHRDPLFSMDVCTRCLRRDLRLIRDRLCVGCMNRQYEFVKRRDRRGNLPLLRLEPRAIGVIVHDGPAVGFYEIGEALTLHAEELRTAVLRLAVGKVEFTEPRGEPSITIAEFGRRVGARAPRPVGGAVRLRARLPKQVVALAN